MAAVDRGPGDAALWSRAAHGEPPQQAFAHSGIGSVTIRVPHGTAYRVTARTQIGSVRVSVPRAAAAAHVIQATTGTGTVTVTGS